MRSVFFLTHTHTPTHTADDSDKYHRTRVRSDSYNTIFSLLTLVVILHAKASWNGGCQIRTTHDVRPHTSRQSMLLLLPCLMMYYIFSVLFLLFVWCPCMAINVSVQYNGGLLPGIILLPQCYCHRGTRLNAIKGFCICSLRPHLNVLTFYRGTRLNAIKGFCICSLRPHLNVLTFSPLTGGCSEGLLPIHSGHQVRWTYQPGSHRRKVTQDFSSTFHLRCVP